MKTSIIIPSFNGYSHLQTCIGLLRKYTETPYEIIVIDNGSQDGTGDFCRKEKITFVSAGNNLGFVRACNLGMKLASGDSLLLLNNDVAVTRNWLSNMLNCLYSRDDIGIVGPYTNYASGKQRIDMPYNNLNQLLKLSGLNRSDPDKWMEVTRLVGFCFLFKRELMNRIGLLDERYSPGHYEDDDYCYRARLAGYRLMIAGDVFVHHQGSASFFKRPKEEVEQLVKTNYTKFLEKWGVDPHIFI